MNLNLQITEPTRLSILGCLKQSNSNQHFLASYAVDDSEKGLAIVRAPFLTAATVDAANRDTFEEARFMSKLRHPNLIQFYEVSQYNERPVVVKEYVNGPNLAELIECIDEAIPLAVVGSIVSQVFDGLDFAYRREHINGRNMEIAHRNISLKNIICSTEGYVKVSGFQFKKSVNDIDGDTAIEDEVTETNLDVATSDSQTAAARDEDIVQLAWLLVKLLSKHRTHPKQIASPKSMASAGLPTELITILKIILGKTVHSVSLNEFASIVRDSLATDGRLLSPMELREWLIATIPNWLEKQAREIKLLLVEPELAKISNLVKNDNTHEWLTDLQKKEHEDFIYSQKTERVFSPDAVFANADCKNLKSDEADWIKRIYQNSFINNFLKK